MANQYTSKDLLNLRIGRLLVIEKTDKRQNQKIIWKCLCDCGKIAYYTTGTLNRKVVVSCGCLKNEKASIRAKKGIYKKHDHAKVGKRSPEYNTWYNMIQRCTNPGSINYKYYGGRGIKVCDKWKNSFVEFLKDMGTRPRKMTLDRINNELGYFKENCRWASQIEQIKNRRN